MNEFYSHAVSLVPVMPGAFRRSNSVFHAEFVDGWKIQRAGFTCSLPGAFLRSKEEQYLAHHTLQAMIEKVHAGRVFSLYAFPCSNYGLFCEFMALFHLVLGTLFPDMPSPGT